MPKTTEDRSVISHLESLYDQLEKRQGSLNYTLRDGELTEKATKHQFIQDCIDLMLLVNMSKLEGKSAFTPNLSTGKALHINSGKENNLEDVQHALRPLIKDMSSPGGELLCVSPKEATHIIDRCRLFLDILQQASEPDASELSVQKSAIIAVNQDSHPAVYFNKAASKALSGLVHLVVEDTNHARQNGETYIFDGVVPKENDLAQKRITVMQTRSTLECLTSGNICFPTMHDLNAAKEFLHDLIGEYADDIEKLTTPKPNNVSRDMQTLASRMSDELRKRIAEGGIEAGHSYIHAQFALAEDAEFKQTADAIKFLKTSGAKRSDATIISLQNAPEQCVARLSALVGKNQVGSLTINEADNILRIPSFAAEQIERNWKRFATLARTGGLDAAKQAIPLNGHTIRTVTTDTVPNPQGVNETKRVPHLEEIVPEDFPIFQSVIGLCKRLANIKRPDKYLSSKDTTVLAFENSELATAARELLRGLADNKGILQKNNVLEVNRTEKDTISANYELMQEGVENAKSALNHGDEDAAKQCVKDIKELIGDASWAAATKYHDHAAKRSVVTAL